MTEIRLLDYSYSRPSNSTIKASGASGVMRYLSHSKGKSLTATEAKALRAAGLMVGVVFEDAATNAKKGTAQGHADALFAQAQATAAGVPETCPIFFAVDFDAKPADVAGYFKGIASAKLKHPIGVYGSAAVVNGILAAKLATYAWQTSAWSGSSISPRAHLYQRQKATHPVPGTDENVLRLHIPLWGAPLPPKPPAKTPAKTPPKAVTQPAPKHPAPRPAGPSTRQRARAALLHRLHLLHEAVLRRRRH